MKVTESTLQAVLMHWAMNEKHHSFVLPNSNVFFHYSWECDLITVTQAGLCHEYEIKLNRADYKRDAAKWKHRWIGDLANAPAYFWYVTYDFEIEPPEKAGWIVVRLDKHTWRLEVKKQAPRLNTWKLTPQKQIEIARLLSWRMTNFYKRNFMRLDNPTDGAGEEECLRKTAQDLLDYYDKYGAEQFNRHFGTADVPGARFVEFLREFLTVGEAEEPSDPV